MHVETGQRFRILGFTGIVTLINHESAVIEFAHISTSGSTKSGIGHACVHLPNAESRQLQISLALPSDFHTPEKINDIRIAIYNALAIPLDQWSVIRVSSPPVMEIQGGIPPDDIVVFVAN